MRRRRTAATVLSDWEFRQLEELAAAAHEPAAAVLRRLIRAEYDRLRASGRCELWPEPMPWAAGASVGRHGA
ncbi:MAG TPA: hypothetical protein VMV87_03465 [Burkholderiales bacterium]|nr:hypothetical protein [Burkholderiales bacterium]